MPERGWHERMEALLAEQGRTPEARVEALSFHVPSGYLFMASDAVNAIHNDNEALRIERDAARDALRRWMPHDHSAQTSPKRPINGCERCRWEAEGQL